MKYIALIIMAFGLTLPTAAVARSVYLNGADISAVRNQTISNATVTIDKDGNVRISAPGYKVEHIDPSAGAAASTREASKPNSRGGANPTLTEKYYLVTQPSENSQYSFTVAVNGVEYKTIVAKDPQVIMEISAWLHKGDNEIHIRAKKDLSAGRKSNSSGDEARIIIGVGTEENKKVKISAVKASVKVNAAMVGTVDKHFVLTAK
ncbi:MAG: hypothetical protein QNJ97_02280 [Myxococcota bacterium]|nr:hypothetical protein [Myxococcota bacterium]